MPKRTRRVCLVLGSYSTKVEGEMIKGLIHLNYYYHVARYFRGRESIWEFILL